jgi:hypothetical protein
MTKKMQITLSVSELFVWRRAHGMKNKRAWPGLLKRAIRRNAECMASFQMEGGTQTNEIVKALKALALVQDVKVFARGDARRLTVYSTKGLVTDRDRRRFGAQVQTILAFTLPADVQVAYYHYQTLDLRSK